LSGSGAALAADVSQFLLVFSLPPALFALARHDISRLQPRGGALSALLNALNARSWFPHLSAQAPLDPSRF
jgi:hypothetical protein